jgi:Kef-type K+ transport system membrane component KefB
MGGLFVLHDESVTFSDLSLICLVGLAGPLLAVPRRGRVPVVVGELLLGLVVGRTGFGLLDASDQTFSFLAEIGFALVMFVVGTQVPVRDERMRHALRVGLLRALGTGVLAAGFGVALARLTGVDHPALYAVLMASSSAALVLPVIDDLDLRGDAVVALLPQIAIADAACIVALPLVIDPGHAVRAAVGGVVVIAAAAALYVVLWVLDERGWRKQLHRVSERRGFAAELRIQLTILFALAGLAVALHVSVMLAGFAFGIAIAAIGEPRRLARQLFALTEGFFGPVFFVWLGATLDLSDLGAHPKMIVLGVGLGIGAAAVHLVWSLAGQPVPLALFATAQLGVPVAAATIGTQLHVLRRGEDSALLLGALLTIGLVILAANLALRHGLGRAEESASTAP